MRTAYLLRRVVQIVPLVLGVVAVNFLIIHLTPGDPASALAGDMAPPEYVEELRRQYGLDKPVIVQLLVYFKHLLTGDLGYSFSYQQPVASLVLDRVPATVLLILAAQIPAIIFGTLLGALAARHHGSWADRLVSILVSLGLALPSIWVALLLSLLFAVKLHWVDVAAYTPFEESPLRWARGLLLPAVALSLHTAAVLARQVRSAMLEALASSYVHAMRARGLREPVIVLRYAVRNAMVPVLSVAAIQMSVLMGASIAVERIFALPGLGTLLIDSVVRGDFPILQGAVLVIATAVLAINLAADVGYALINPKVRAS